MPVEAATDWLEPGVVVGEYRIERLLGRGGMGAVYEATHLTDGRIVALKLLRVDLDQIDARQRFLREGRVAAAINHPNAVYIYGTEEINGTPAIVMELVAGGTLDDLVKRNGPVSIHEAVEIVLHLIDGLDAALSVGVLHRDVKPSNCFIAADGSTKIGDFGLSKPVDSIEQNKITQTGLFLGTPVYSSPEQLLGESLDQRSDIYAVGVTFYYLLTGRLPFETGSMMQVMAAVLNGTPAPMDNAVQNIPPHVQQVVHKAMARHAKDRYQSYSELRDAVASLRAPEYRPATLWERLRAWLVDTVPISYMMSGLLLIVYNARGIVVDPAAVNRDWLLPVATLIAMLFTVAVPEGIRGAALGKWLLDIQVIEEHGRPIGIMRSAFRLTLLSFTGLLMAVTYRYVPDPFWASVFTASVYLLGVLVPFSTARKSNGWRMLQDVVTNSRVVRLIPRPRQRKSDIDARDFPALRGDEVEVGQYVSTGEVPAHPGVQSGWDRAMQRRVWIARQQPGAEMSDVRRGVSRFTRLRWTGGVRDNDQRYDVFEAPTGEPLEQRLDRPVSWAVVRNWLTDMLEEARSAERDGSWPRAASISYLWITKGDDIVLTDALAHEEGTQQLSPVQLVAELAKLLLVRTEGNPRPVYATSTLKQIGEATSLDDVSRVLRDIMARPVEVTRRRRIGPMTIISAGAVIVAFFSATIAVQTRQSDVDGVIVEQLVEFIDDNRACSYEYSVDTRVRSCLTSDSTSEQVSEDVRRLRTATSRALSLLRIPVYTATDTLVKSVAQAAREKRYAEIYLSSIISERLRRSGRAGETALDTDVRNRALDIVANSSVADSTEVAGSVWLVDTLWQSRVMHRTAESNRLIRYVVILTLLSLAATASFAAAITARRGLLLRGFQIDFVDSTGKPASRVRMVVRTVACWFPFLLPFAALAMVHTLPVATHALALIALALPALVLWIYGIVSVIRSPGRGLPERIAGVWAVIE